MASRKSSAVTVAVNVVELESAAVAAFTAIESGMSVASKAVLAYVLGCKEAKVTPAVFDAGIARISDAIPGVLKVTAGAYIANAKRIWACDADRLEAAKKAAGTGSIKALAAACPAVSKAKAEGQAKRAEEKKASAPAAPAAPAAPSTPTVSTPANNPMLAANNAMVAMRKLAAGKRKAKLILAAIGEVEDMLQDIADLMIA